MIYVLLFLLIFSTPRWFINGKTIIWGVLFTDQDHRKPPFIEAAVGGDGDDILNLSDLHSWASKGSESWLGPWSRGLGPVSFCGSEFDVEGSDASSLHLWATSWAAKMAADGEDSSHPSQLLPSSHQLHSRCVTCQKDWWRGQKCHWRMQRCAEHQIHFLLSHLGSEADDLFFLFSFPLQGATSVHLLQPLTLETSEVLTRDTKKTCTRPR